MVAASGLVSLVSSWVMSPKVTTSPPVIDGMSVLPVAASSFSKVSQNCCLRPARGWSRCPCRSAPAGAGIAQIVGRDLEGWRCR